MRIQEERPSELRLTNESSDKQQAFGHKFSKKQPEKVAEDPYAFMDALMLGDDNPKKHETPRMNLIKDELDDSCSPNRMIAMS